MSHNVDSAYFTEKLENNIALISIGENLVGGNEALKFSNTLIDLVKQNYKTIILDLQKVKIINSSGIGMLVSGLTTLKKNNASLILIKMPDKIQSLLKMTHLDQVFTTYSNLDEALKHC